VFWSFSGGRDIAVRSSSARSTLMGRMPETWTPQNCAKARRDSRSSTTRTGPSLDHIKPWLWDDPLHEASAIPSRIGARIGLAYLDEAVGSAVGSAV
jgi:hypothetical protein